MEEWSMADDAPLIQVAEMFGMAIYAKMTEAGGMAYYTDDVGGGQCIIDLTIVDESAIRFVLDNKQRLHDDYMQQWQRLKQQEKK